jgi:hypothetical protein
MPGMKRLLMGLWLAAARAQGQEPAPPPKPALDTVEVVGHREKLGKQVQNFVSALTQLDGDLVSSWVMPVCPKVVAENPAHAEYIRQRLLQIVADVPFAADADAGCRPNLFVILTDAPEKFIASWKARDPGMFIWRPRRGVSRSAESLPVRTWHNVTIEAAGGGSKIVGEDQIPTFKSGGGGSRIENKVSENLQSVLVLVDTNKAAGVTMRQLADYIAMVSFSKVDLDADFGQSDSILKLFASDSAIARPVGVTTWDLAFLRGLYRQSFEAAHQRTAISSRMMLELGESASRDAQR